MASGKTEILLGLQGTLYLAVTPRSSFRFTSAPTVLSQRQNKISLEGKCERIPDGTACEIILARAYDAGTPHPPEEVFLSNQAGLHGVMKVTGDSFKVQVSATDASSIVLDALAHGLIGVGRLHVSIKPALPGCNEDLEHAPEVVFPFDNQVRFSVSPTAPDSMGASCTFKPTHRTGLFKGRPIRLTIEEYDEATAEKPLQVASDRHLSHDLEWTTAEDQLPARSWRVGCRQDPVDPKLVHLLYPGPNDHPPFSYGYTVWAKLDDRWTRVPYGPVVFAAVAKPSIGDFAVHLAIPEAGPAGFVGPPPKNLLEVSLALKGFAADALIGVEVSVWHAKTEGEKVTASLVGDVHLSGLYDASKPVNTWSAPTSMANLTDCFAVLRFSDTSGPATGVVDLNLKDGYRVFVKDDGGVTGRLLDPTRALTADGVASKEAGPFVALAAYATDDLETLALALGIFTEARDNPNPTQRRAEMLHVGAVIQNRATTAYRKNTSCLTAVLDPFQFSYFNKPSAEKSALMSHDVAKVRKWADALPRGDQDRFVECANVARGLLGDPSSSPFASDRTVRHYYSPRSMVGADAPDWTKTRSTAAEVSVPSISANRFRWYRGIA